MIEHTEILCETNKSQTEVFYVQTMPNVNTVYSFGKYSCSLIREILYDHTLEIRQYLTMRTVYPISAILLMNYSFIQILEKAICTIC